jgi:hypothetical protein
VYQYYDITLQGTNTVTLTYKLEQHRPAQVWAGLMSSAEVKNLRSTLNPWLDFDKSILPSRVNHLLELVDKLNEWLPSSKKITEKWDHNNHQLSVNKFHIHFPEQEKTETDPVRKSQLSEYNDLIHEIEILAFGRNKKQIPHLLICPEYYEMIPLESNDYKLFRAQRKFGELCLHYCHVGRHPFELFAADDINCPIDQIVPQSRISTFHTLRFYTDDFLEHYFKPRFREFYERSTLKQLLPFNDPRMAFGYIPMGKLVTDLSSEEIINQVKSCNTIINWRLY